MIGHRTAHNRPHRTPDKARQSRSPRRYSRGCCPWDRNTTPSAALGSRRSETDRRSPPDENRAMGLPCSLHSCSRQIRIHTARLDQKNMTAVQPPNIGQESGRLKTRTLAGPPVGEPPNDPPDNQPGGRSFTRVNRLALPYQAPMPRRIRQRAPQPDHDQRPRAVHKHDRQSASRRRNQPAKRSDNGVAPVDRPVACTRADKAYLDQAVQVVAVWLAGTCPLEDAAGHAVQGFHNGITAGQQRSPRRNSRITLDQQNSHPRQ